MRIFSLFLILAATLVANDKYAIQVLSVKNKASISEDFMAKVNKISMPSRGMQGENGYYKVFYGGIKTYQSAALILPYIRANVSEDAFILKEKEVAFSAYKEPSAKSMAIKPEIEKVTIVGPQEKIAAKENWRFQKLKIKPAKSDMVQAAKMAKSTQSESSPVKKHSVKKQATDAKVAKTAVATTSQTKAKVKNSEVEKVELVGPQDMPMQANEKIMDEMDLALCQQVKKSKRKEEIAEAVAFYAGSPYYSFNK